MSLRGLLAGAAAASLALAPIPAYANPGLARAGADMAEASAQADDQSPDHIVGIVFVIIIFAVIIFASDSGDNGNDDDDDDGPGGPVSP